MDELEISGKRYISTRRAAREHGYHSDYMGQLIRGKKVAGQKVGRAWYIEESSLNAYLGHAPAVPPAPAAPSPAPEPVMDAVPAEPAVIEEPAAAMPEPEPVVEASAPEPTAVEAEPAQEIQQEVQEERPVIVHSAPQAEPAQPQIHHAPLYIEHETRIPIHTQAQAMQEIGGLRYAADDSPSIPVVTRMPQARVQAHYAPAPRSSVGKFPLIGLSIVGIMAVLAATFASNFISATIVSEPGKAATVQYAIHW